MAEHQSQQALRARQQGEMQSFAQNAIRTELASIELAEQRAVLQSRMEMTAQVGARDMALDRSRAELEMANSGASAEIYSLTQVRMAENEVRIEAQRLRDEAADAARMASSARTEAETIKAQSDAGLHKTERAAEEAIAEKSARPTRAAEDAFRHRVET
jgi:hypothetical protein